MTPEQMNELIGKVWDRWGGLEKRKKGKIRRIAPAVADVLDDMERQVRNDLANIWRDLNGRTP